MALVVNVVTTEDLVMFDLGWLDQFNPHEL